MPYKTRRCYWFDEDGQPRPQRSGFLGCDSQNCNFIHPEDPEWASSYPTKPPPHLQFRPERSPPPRRASTSTYAPLSRAPVGLAMSPTIPSASSMTITPTRPTFKQRLSSTASIARKVSNESLVKARDRDPDVPMRDRSPSNSVSSHDPRDRERDRGRDRERHTPTYAPSYIPQAAKPPLQPTMHPPPTLKVSSPTELNAHAGPSKSGPTYEQKLDAWVNRVKSLADAVNMRLDYLRIERDLISFRQMSNSKRYADISPETRDKLSRGLVDLETKWNDKKDELNRAVYRLVDLDYWPVGTQITDGMSPDDRFQMMRLMVWDLRDKVKELSEIVHAANVQGVSAKDVSKKESSEQPPLKRRRVSESEEGEIEIAPVSGPSTSAPPPPPGSAPIAIPPPQHAILDPEQLSNISDRFGSLEGRVADLENDMVQHDQSLSDQLDEKLEEKLAELDLRERKGKGKAIDLDEDAPPDTGQFDAAQFKLLQSNVASVGEDIEGLAVEVASLITWKGDKEVEIQKLKEENQELRDHTARLEKQQEETSAELKTQRSELNALNAAVSAFITQAAAPPAPPPPLAVSNVDVLLESLLPPLLAATRQDIEVRIGEARRDIEDMLRSQNGELSGTVFAKLGNVLRAIETIKAWMERALQEGHVNGVHLVNPLVVNGGPLQVSNGVRPVNTSSVGMASKSP